jgi:UDP-glucuronate 4-epimerase
MSKTLVTGCAGFIGSHLCEALLSKGREVVGVDRIDDYYDPTIKIRNLHNLRDCKRFSFIQDDVVNLTPSAYAGVSSVFHLAARPGVRPSVGNGQLYIRDNVVASQSILDTATLAGVRHFIVASSSSVYGNVQAPFMEIGPTAPVSPYGATKLAVEALCDAHVSCNPDITVMSMRIFCAYGPRCRPDLILPKFAMLIAAGLPIPVFGDPALLSRDWTYIDDIISGLLAAERYASETTCIGHVTVNLGNGTPILLSEAIQAIGDALGRKPILDLLPKNIADAATTHADTRFAERLLKWKATTPYREGVAKYIEWWEVNNAYIR